MITVRGASSRLPSENTVNCGPGEWDKVRVYREDGESVVGLHVETEN